MFLDDKLLQLGRNNELTDEGIRECVGLMLNACFDNLQKNINSKSPEQAIKASFKRVNNTWKMVANKLDSEGRGFVKETGFQIFVESKPEFKGIFF